MLYVIDFLNFFFSIFTRIQSFKVCYMEIILDYNGKLYAAIDTDSSEFRFESLIQFSIQD